MFLPQLDYSLLPKRLQYRPRIIFIQPLYWISPTPQTSSFHFVVDWLLGKTRHQRIKCHDYTSPEKKTSIPTPQQQGLAWKCLPEKSKETNLFQHLVLFVEKLHFDIAADGQRLREFKVHVLVFTAGGSWRGGEYLYLELVHHKLRIWVTKPEWHWVRKASKVSKKHNTDSRNKTVIFSKLTKFLVRV